MPEIPDILSEPGVRDSRRDDVLNLVASEQDDAGRWRIENTYNSGRLLIPLDKRMSKANGLHLER